MPEELTEEEELLIYLRGAQDALTIALEKGKEELKKDLDRLVMRKTELEMWTAERRLGSWIR